MKEIKKSTVCFIRHGQTDWNTLGLMQGREDIPLNERGREQAREAAESLYSACFEGNIKFDRIVSSPLSRAYEMASIIGKRLGGVTVITDERATERDFGELSGKPYGKTSDAIIRDCPQYPTLETVKSLVTRISGLICDHASMGENVLVVTHGAVSRIFADNAPHSESFSGVFDPFLNNCHTVIYEAFGGKAYLIGYNIHPAEIYKYIR